MKKLILLTISITIILSHAGKMKDGLYATINTNKGSIKLQLEFEKTPLTVANFVGLAEGTKKSNKKLGVPFYDGVIFHRVIKNFMIQTGDPEGTGRGGPGYRFADEFVDVLVHQKGVISMANAGPATNGSQFFITHTATPHLDGKHTVFGKVIEGMDAVDAIANTPVVAQDKPAQDIVIESIKIDRIGAAAQAFKTDETAFQNYQETAEDRKKKQQAEKLQKQTKQLKGFLVDLEKKYGKVEKTKNGIHYVILKLGTGVKPKAGSSVNVHYTGSFLDGRKFDSSVDRGQPFSFPVGAGRVIPGWDQAVAEMLENEKRLIVLPSELAYGEQGSGPIPPNAILVFEIERL